MLTRANIKTCIKVLKELDAGDVAYIISEADSERSDVSKKEVFINELESKLEAELDDREADNWDDDEDEDEDWPERGLDSDDDED